MPFCHFFQHFDENRPPKKCIANLTQMYILTINTILQQKFFGHRKIRTLKKIKKKLNLKNYVIR